MPAGIRRRAHTTPGSLVPFGPHDRVPVDACDGGCYTAMEGTITVHVRPRSGRTLVMTAPNGGVVIRVRSAPEDGKATEEARRALAAAIGLARSDVRLISGARSRVKVFAVKGWSSGELEDALHAR